MNFSVYPRGRNLHHIKPPDDAGNTTGVKRTPDVDPRETKAGEAEHSGEGWLALLCSLALVSTRHTSILQSFQQAFSWQRSDYS